MKKQVILLLVLLFFVTLPVSASEYYADTLFEISENGETKISGTTNYPSLEEKISQEYTYKIGPKWEFKLDLKENFSEYVYEIRFPQGTEIEEVKTNIEYRVTTTNGQITLIGAGNDTTINIEVTYKIQKKLKITQFIS